MKGRQRKQFQMQTIRPTYQSQRPHYRGHSSGLQGGWLQIHRLVPCLPPVTSKPIQPSTFCLKSTSYCSEEGNHLSKLKLTLGLEWAKDKVRRSPSLTLEPPSSWEGFYIPLFHDPFTPFLLAGGNKAHSLGLQHRTPRVVSSRQCVCAHQSHYSGSIFSLWKPRWQNS